MYSKVTVVSKYSSIYTLESCQEYKYLNLSQVKQYFCIVKDNYCSDHFTVYTNTELLYLYLILIECYISIIPQLKNSLKFIYNIL